VLAGIIVLLLVYTVAVLADLELLRSVLAMAVPYLGIALIVLFQAEIRRTPGAYRPAALAGFRWEPAAARIDRRYPARSGAPCPAEDRGADRSRARHRPAHLHREWVALNAVLSRDLLLSIFHTGGALHDGAVVIQGEKVAAAACFLPLSMNPLLARNWARGTGRPSGSRRRPTAWRWWFPKRAGRFPSRPSASWNPT